MDFLLVKMRWSVAFLVLGSGIRVQSLQALDQGRQRQERAAATRPSGIWRREGLEDSESSGANEGEEVRPAAGDAGDFFEESLSGGSQEAWQTSEASGDRHRSSLNWGLADGRSATGGTGDAAWFESSVRDYDYYGRRKQPAPLSDQSYAEWTIRQRTGNLSCGPPGCSANTTLMILNHSEEEHQHCRLSLLLHATDFDDPTREGLEVLRVNGHALSISCRPMAHGCGLSDPRALYPCVQDMPVDGIIGDAEAVTISAKITEMVDECAIDGHLLSGMVTLTCYVKERERVIPVAAVSKPATTDKQGNLKDVWFGYFHCDEPGCEASVAIPMHPVGWLASLRCRLTVLITQTDFDSADGTEEVEWVKVAGVKMREHLRPGRNPCNERNFSATHPQGISELAVLINDADITEHVRTGLVNVSAKISAMVDECADDSRHLLNGTAVIRCYHSENASAEVSL